MTVNRPSFQKKDPDGDAIVSPQNLTLQLRPGIILFLLSFCHIWTKYIHKIQMVKQGSPSKPANKPYLKKTTFKNIWLNYEIKYWHRQDNLTKHIHFFIT